MRTYIYILNLLFLLNFIYSEDWTMTFYAQDIEQNGTSDYVILEMCDDCNDLFHFGEDEYDLPVPPNYYTDISFMNFDWVGTLDNNGNECVSPEFYIDKKSFHNPLDLIQWNIGGFSNLPLEDIPIELEWTFSELPNEYEIFLYIGDAGYNMRNQDSLIINQSELTVNYIQRSCC